MAAVTNPIKGNDIIVVFRIPREKQMMKTIIPVSIGAEKFRINAFFEVRRQTNKGPTPVRNSNIKPRGMFT
jgi:hypothetical protein